MRHKRRLIRARTILMAIGVACLINTGGCQFAPTLPYFPDYFSKKDDSTGLPDRVMPFWTDTVLYQPQQPGIRGFGGRVYFYRDGKERPVEVDGGLVVYAFDNEAPPSEAGKPIKKYVFTPDQFATHMSRTNIGVSYSIWLPWDEVGGATKQLSLVARFEGREGGVVISEPTVKLLPGVNEKLARKNQAEPDPEGSVQPASFISGQITSTVKTATIETLPAENPSNPKAPLSPGRSTTIDLPPSFQRHLLNGHAHGSRESDASQHRSPSSPAALAPNAASPSVPTDSPPTSVGTEYVAPADDKSSSNPQYNSKVLRDTFRKPATSRDGQSVPNGRPASWLVSPR